MDFLARREYSRCELQKKLQQKFPGNEDIASVLDELIVDGLQSDSRFTDSFLRLRVNAGYGPQYIRAELRQRGVTEDIVEEAFSDLSVDWFDVAQQLFSKKFSDQDMSDAKLRAKCLRYFQYKGFTFDHIRDLL